MQEMRIWSLDQEDHLEKDMENHQDSCLENPMDRGTWQATVRGLQKSDTI